MLTATWLRKNGLAIPKDHWLRRGRRFDPIVADRLLWGLGFGPLIAAFVSTVVPMLWIAIRPNFTDPRINILTMLHCMYEKYIQAQRAGAEARSASPQGGGIF